MNLTINALALFAVALALSRYGSSNLLRGVAFIGGWLCLALGVWRG